MSLAITPHSVSLLCVLTVAVGMVLAMQARAAGVSGVRVVSEHTPDLYRLDAYVDSVIQPDMTQEQKALALWHATGRQMYHWQNPMELPAIPGRTGSDVTDPIKLMNVYGFTLCFCSGSMMEAIWREAGLEAREFGAPGHVAPEVWYNGAYHYLDLEMGGYFNRPDGTVASIRECGLEPAELIVRPKFPPEFFPLRKDPFRTYLTAMVYAGIVDAGPEYYASYRAQGGHVMNVTLRKGEAIYRSWDNVGRFLCDYQRLVGTGLFGTFDIRYGPKDRVSGRSFGNGVLVYQPDCTSATYEFDSGVLEYDRVETTTDGLAAGAAQDGWAVFDFHLPYVIAGDPNRLQNPDDTTDAVVVDLQCDGDVGVEVSTDHGATWQDADHRGPGRVDLSRFLEGRYGYRLKFTIPAGATLRSFRCSTSFQLAPTALPSLRAGRNRMTLKQSDAPWDMTTIDPPTWSGRKAFEKSIHSSENIRWSRDWPIAVSTADASKPGWVVYELQAPPGKRLRRVSIDLGGSLRWQQWHEDRVELSVAADSPEGFRSLGRVHGGPYSGHWLRRLQRDADFPREQDVRRAYVRVDMFRKWRAALSDIRFRLYFEDIDASPAGPADLVITHGWMEGGSLRTSRHTGLSAGDSYTVECGAEFERPVYLCIENPGRAGEIAGTDPLGLRNYQPRPPEYFPSEAAGHSNAKLLRQLDAEGMEKADTMVRILTERDNEPVANEVAKILGYRPVEAVRSVLDDLHRKSPDDPRWQRGLAILDEQRAPSREAFLREFLPTLKADAFGLEYLDRLAELGRADDLPALRDAISRVEDLDLQRAMVRAGMALGAADLAPRAEALVKSTRSEGKRYPLDVQLLRCPDHAESAAGRLRNIFDSPHEWLRSDMMQEVARWAGPDAPAAVEAVLRDALADDSPYVRLGAVSALYRRGGGIEMMQQALQRESVDFLRDAMREYLELQHR